MVSSLTAMQPMHDGAFSRYPDQKDFIDLAPEFGTRFTLFIDTEEEFDWHKPFSRTGYTVQSLKGLTEGQGYLTALACGQFIWSIIRCWRVKPLWRCSGNGSQRMHVMWGRDRESTRLNSSH